MRGIISRIRGLGFDPVLVRMDTSSTSAAMDYSYSLVDTSLDLNINPRRSNDVAPVRERLGLSKEVQSNFMELGRKVSVKQEVRFYIV